MHRFSEPREPFCDSDNSINNKLTSGNETDEKPEDVPLNKERMERRRILIISAGCAAYYGLN